MSKTHDQQRTVAWLNERLHDGTTFEDACKELVDHLTKQFPLYSWVGIYLLSDGQLELVAWDGPEPTRHTTIPLGVGLCGFATSTGRLVNIPDVAADERYLQCFASTKSELVVPIECGGTVYGEIDIDSDETHAFSDADEQFVAELCRVLGARAAAEGRVGHAPGA